MGKILSVQPVAFEAIHALRSEHTSTVIDEIVVQEGMEKVFFTLLEEPLFVRRLSVLGIFHKEDKAFCFNPDASECFKEGDVAILLANPVLLNEFKTKLHRRSV